MSQIKTPDIFHFIINPKAGRRDGSYLVGAIESVFANAPNGMECRILMTEQPGHATNLAAEIAARFGERTVIVACGGDGTAREVAAGVVGTRAAMSLLPIGTANDFAHAFLSTTSVDRLLPKLTQPEIRPIDVIAVDDTISLNITSLGFDTKVQRKALQINERFRFLGRMVYPIAIALSLFGKRSYSLAYAVDTIQPDGTVETIRGQASIILAAICNGQYYGGGFNPAPQARVDDGELLFCLVDNLSLKKILTLLPRYKKGTHFGDPAIHAWPVRSGDIEGIDESLLGNYDGDSFVREKIHFDVLHRALHFAFY